MKKSLSTFIALFLVATVLAYTSEIHAMENDSDENQSENEAIPQDYLDILLLKYYKQNNSSECEKLLKLGANPTREIHDNRNIYDTKRSIFLFKAINECINNNDNISMVELLIKYTKNIDVQDKNGNTPLHCACNPWHYSDSQKILAIVKAILDQNPNLNIENIEGKIPLEYAIEKLESSFREQDPTTVNELLSHYENFKINLPSLIISLNFVTQSPSTLRLLMKHFKNPFKQPLVKKKYKRTIKPPSGHVILNTTSEKNLEDLFNSSLIVEQ